MKPGRVILIPGTFNPPTNAHIAMSQELHKVFPGSKIVYVPCNDNYTVEYKKQQGCIKMEDRVRLLYGCINQKYSYVSIFEANADPYGYLIDTARYYHSIYDDVAICLGDDNLKHFDTWKDAEALIQENMIVYFHRAGYCGNFCKLIQDHHWQCISVPGVIPNISSTKIRQAYLDGNWDLIIQNVPENVFLYLRYTDGLFE